MHKGKGGVEGSTGTVTAVGWLSSGLWLRPFPVFFFTWPRLPGLTLFFFSFFFFEVVAAGSDAQLFFFLSREMENSLVVVALSVGTGPSYTPWNWKILFYFYFIFFIFFLIF